MPAIESVQDSNSIFGIQIKVQLWVPIKNAPKPPKRLFVWSIEFYTF